MRLKIDVWIESVVADLSKFWQLHMVANFGNLAHTGRAPYWPILANFFWEWLLMAIMGIMLWWLI